MVLEDLGVRKEAMLELQNLAKAVVVTASDSMAETINLLRKHDLGHSFGLRHILEHLHRAGMCMRREASSPDVMDNEFILQLVKYAQHHILHEIKHDARIPIPNAHQLVGVADEGPAYMLREEYKDKEVFCLGMGEIFGASHSDVLRLLL